MKRYKIYFSKTDTPFVQDFQPKKKYHTAWVRLAYTRFLGHRVVKVKKYGIFTVFREREVKDGN